MINILTKLAINIEIDDCQEKLEKDEKLEQLRHVPGWERLTVQNLGSRYDPSSVRKRGTSKKRLPPIPLWSPCDSAARTLRRTRLSDTRTIYQSVGCELGPNSRTFSSGPHSRRISAYRAGFHSDGKLLGQAFSRSFLDPALAVVMTQDNRTIVQREPDPQAVQGEERQDRPKKHAFEQVIEGAEQQAPQPVPVAQDGFRLAVKGPCRLSY